MLIHFDDPDCKSVYPEQATRDSEWQRRVLRDFGFSPELAAVIAADRAVLNATFPNWRQR